MSSGTCIPGLREGFQYQGQVAYENLDVLVTESYQSLFYYLLFHYFIIYYFIILLFIISLFYYLLFHYFIIYYQFLFYFIHFNVYVPWPKYSQ